MVGGMVGGPSVDSLAKWEHLTDLMNAPGASHAGNHAIAYPMAVLAGYAYSAKVEDLECIARKLFGTGSIRIDRFRVRVDGMLIESTADLIRIPREGGGHVGILCYRGTRPQDVVSILGVLEIDAAKVQACGWPGAVHSGFYRNFMATRDEVADALRRADRGLYDADESRHPGELEALYITGHSLGGAMGVLMALTLVTSRDQDALQGVAGKLKAVYTFGQPMIGDHEFTEYCEKMLGGKVTRYIYRQDVVPRVPPGLSEGEFEHFGVEYRQNQGDAEWWYSPKPTARGGWRVLFTPVAWLERRVYLHALRHVASWLRRNLYSIDDHAPHYYIASFENSPQTGGGHQR